MPGHHKPEEAINLAAEEYELSTQAQDQEPLLPRYEEPEREWRQPTKRPARSHKWCFRASMLTLGGLFAVAIVAGSLTGKTRVLDNLMSSGSSAGAASSEDFPTDIGYEGPTPTGAEAALLATSPPLPLYSGVSPIVPPESDSDFIIHHHWGNLSPYHSVKSHGLKEASQAFPDDCELDEMHWLQRHGARYPTTSGGPAKLAERLKAKGWTAKGELKFLNDWNYKLGAELLTPFGRSQLYNLGVAARVKYGFLLERMEDRLPVFRTESQDRMLRSAQNFAAGFFGIPAEEQYNLEVMIEWPGFNCSLAPYHSCPNDLKMYPVVNDKLAQWDAIFLKKAVKHLQKHIDGFELTNLDVLYMMDMCAYETVALGHSAFCSLFTEKEWKGYQYRNDIYWWYGASFGAPVAAAEGIGYLQELTARLTHTPLKTHNSSTNSTLHDDVHFPVNEPFYFDFTHDTTFAQLLPTMNLTTFSKAGPPPLDHIPKHWPFVSSKFSPFATNLQVQVLSCKKRSKRDDEEVEAVEGGLEELETEVEAELESENSNSDSDDVSESNSNDDKDANTNRYVRIILNDAPVPLTGINGCKENEDGLCDFDAFVSSMHTLIGETDHAYACREEYEWDEVVDGRPPAQ